MYEQDLALNNLPGWYAMKPNQPLLSFRIFNLGTKLDLLQN